MKHPARFEGSAALCVIFLLTACGGRQPLPEEVPVMEPGDPESTSRSPEPIEGEPEPPGRSPEPASENPAPVPEPAPVAEPEPIPPPESAPETMAEPPPSVPLEGSIVSRKGKSVVIEADHPDPPAAGAKGTLSKYFEKQVGPFATSGWLGIAEVTVKKSVEGKIHLQIVEELSKMVVNGKKVNHFKKGNKVKLELE